MGGAIGRGDLNQKPNNEEAISKLNMQKQHKKKLNREKSKKEIYEMGKIAEVYPQNRCLLRIRKMEMLCRFLEYEKQLLEWVSETSTKKDDLQRQLDKIRGNTWNIGVLEEWTDETRCIVSGGGIMNQLVTVMSFVEKDIEVGQEVLYHPRTHNVIGTIKEESDPTISAMKIEKAPMATYEDIGGLDEQIQEIREAVEFPMTTPEIYEQIGIDPPKGIIMYGPPGTGKTLIAKAVANRTNATFLQVVGSEFVQKYLGEGPRLVRELFKAANAEAPSIIFIDEIDAIGTKRYDNAVSGELEIQRTMLELLNQLDGFDTTKSVKVIMATNMIDALDPALIRPGRIDRKIHIPIPDLETQRKIFSIHTRKMSLDESVDVNQVITAQTAYSGAEIRALCTEAGLLALRERRFQIHGEDFDAAKKKIQLNKLNEIHSRMYQ